MPEEIVMPRLSDTMQVGTIARWVKHEGDAVKTGDVLIEVETDKATLELTSYHDGTLAQIVIGDGGTAPVGTIVGILARVGESVASVRIATAPTQAPTATVAQTPTQATPAAPVQAQAVAAPVTAGPAAQDVPAEAVKASPLARVLAEQSGVDLRTLAGHGSGPGGRIVRADVEAAAHAHAQAQPPVVPVASSPSEDAFTDEPLNRMRQAIARGMGIAKPGIPHIYLTVEAEMDEALALRQQINDLSSADPRAKLSVNDLVIKASALALRTWPAVNAWFLDEAPARIRTWHQVNIGVAVSVAGGLIVPVIRDVSGKSLGQIARETKDVYDRVRSGKPAANDLQGATFTVSNLGAYGTEEFAAVIASPQAAILAVGAALPRAVVHDGQIVVRTTMRITLSADHRVVDGAYAAQFLKELKRLLEHPISLVL
ncbi:MAG: 2-oxo acid dehydrogenase subunit E2 [Proteobacteria bacterium]|jgi:pyruvate dehydrogenase E2 component (dihydrolipoamide acetyltransferase)|nr:2-oxo acid dehydrogenase subunit E2 [Pseudomonadota bacterium]NBX45627.1 2-oxo acid dehydrogenase subunit E2 [Chloroflexota bacterium]NBQ60990.1 2-oxo acid dehydrogenase subunit E2 [Pseudomonadota bacterium]NBT02862.1 2-oxo acid dehydrogenase subunit E2 [Pseudomonadota bacterium]NBT18687.1 2-oxo acid dehydrogenase subunit E2 [Pseudomonadota bacterium]